MKNVKLQLGFNWCRAFCVFTANLASKIEFNLCPSKSPSWCLVNLRASRNSSPCKVELRLRTATLPQPLRYSDRHSPVRVLCVQGPMPSWEWALSRFSIKISDLRGGILSES